MTRGRDEGRSRGGAMDFLSFAKKQASGGEATCVKLPEGVEFYKLELGTHRVDFMPFKAGPLMERTEQADEGFRVPVLVYYAHRLQRPSGDARLYCCLAENFRKRCPACALANATSDGDLAKSLRAKKRSLWLLNPKPGPSKRPQWKVLDQGWFNRGMGFGELMTAAANVREEYRDFWELRGGYTAQLTVGEQSMPGFKWNAVNRVDFFQRDYDYPDSLLDLAPVLETCLVEKTYDELEAILNGAPDTEEGHASGGNGHAPSRSSARVEAAPPRRKPAEDEDDGLGDEPGSRETAEDYGIRVGTRVRFDGDAWTVAKVSPDGTSLTLKAADGSGEVRKAIGPDEVDEVLDDDEGDEDDAPPARGKAGKPTARKAADDEDEDEDEDLDADEGDSDLDDEGDEEETEEEEEADDEPAPRGKAPSRKPAAAEDDDEDDWGDDEDEEPKPSAKPAPGKKPGRK